MAEQIKEIKETLQTLCNAKTLADIDKPELKDKVAKMRDIFLSANLRTKSIAEKENLFKTFRESDPLGALKKLIEIRVGSGGSGSQKPSFDLEDKQSNASCGYRYYLAAYLNVLADEATGKHFLEGGGVLEALKELSNQDLLNKRDLNPNASMTADAADSFLALFANISMKDNLKDKLGEELKKNDFYPKLEPYLKSKYSSFSFF